MIAATLCAWRTWQYLQVNAVLGKGDLSSLDSPHSPRHPLDPEIWRDLARSRAQHAARLRERARGWGITFD